MTLEATASSGAHLSIGEVLDQLRSEFPDVTISKIRFLESQGLIDPERTPSGYRRFYPPDLQRLRWILLQQRDHFLPLRVIKERLDAFGPTGAPRIGSTNGEPPPKSAPPPTGPREMPPLATEAAQTPAPLLPTEETESRTPAPPSAPRPPATPAARPTVPVAAKPAPRPTPPASPREPVAELDEHADTEDDEDRVGSIHPGPTSASSTDLTRAELLEATGLTSSQLDALEAFGLLASQEADDGVARYDDEMLAIAELAAGCYRRGIEARHLKMYWHFTEREATLFAQVLMPYVKQRNPAARAKLQGELEELARLGRRLRTAMLRRALRTLLAE
jgi:DNA-binding transcriptional MerR regulator